MHSFYCEGHGAWFWVEADQSIANPASGDTTREPRVGARVKVEWVHPKLRRIEKTMEKYRKNFLAEQRLFDKFNDYCNTKVVHAEYVSAHCGTVSPGVVYGQCSRAWPLLNLAKFRAG